MRNKILIIGGYEKIGKVISSHLVNWFPNKIIIAGRNVQKAQRWAIELGNSVEGISFDPTDHQIDKKILEKVTIVLMTIELESIDFIEYCLKHGINYIDITPTTKTIEKIQGLDNLAKKHASTGLISVGLSPGLTNLIVKELQNTDRNISKINIFAKLGYGETTGYNSFLWSFKNINSELYYYSEGEKTKSKSFVDSTKYKFTGDTSARKVYRFNFPEPVTVPKTLLIPSINYWLCYEAKFGTALLAKIRWLFKFKKVRRFLASYYAKKAVGEDLLQCAVEGMSSDALSGKKIIEVIGKDQGKITATITAIVTKIFYLNKKNFNAGIFHIEELFTLDDIKEVYSLCNLSIKKHY